MLFFQGLLGLPSAIDVERFAEVWIVELLHLNFYLSKQYCKARAFEIEAMHNAMKSAGYVQLSESPRN